MMINEENHSVDPILRPAEKSISIRRSFSKAFGEYEGNCCYEMLDVNQSIFLKEYRTHLNKLKRVINQE